MRNPNRSSTGRRATRSRRGAALTITLLSSFVVVGVGVAMLTVSGATQREYRTMVMRAQRRYLAQTGVAESLAAMCAGGTGNLGTQASPISRGVGTFRVAGSNHADGSLTLDAIGRVGTGSRAIRAVARESTRSVFDSAMYAGNATKNLSYVLPLAGVGTGADVVNGDIYSGGGIDIGGDAVVNGVLRAFGDITGATGEEGANQPAPDIQAMNYASNNGINVASAFAQQGVYRSRTSLGGSAFEVPEASPAHIFRMNPSDRRTEFQGTQKNDYFLEDPYEAVSTSSTTTAARATPVTLAGVSGEPGNSGNGIVYYIDGNLWIHNKNIFSFAIRHNEASGVQVTFVVKGNVYFSDNILLQDTTHDGVAIIAIKDDAVTDSGNIYFGDPIYGTLEKMQTYMYAENNFHDNNLAQSGSSVVEVDGIMSAGNFVQVDRSNHTPRAKLILDFDPRVRDGTIHLPGLPGTSSTTSRRSFQVLAEFEIPAGE